jgi:predicted ArsR family transcriptional regulator
MDELEAVGEPEARRALLFARRRARPVTADELAAAEGVHRNVARARLERLAAAGLLEVGYERRTGRSGPGAGRPAKTYAVAPELRAIQFPERHYEALLGHALDALPRRGRDTALRRIGSSFADDLADRAGLTPQPGLRDGLEEVCRAVGELGFQAAVAEVEDGVAAIATPTCPLRPLVRERPEAAVVDRAMWAGLAARAVAGCTVEDVECETRDCLGDHSSCRVLLRLRRSKN